MPPEPPPDPPRPLTPKAARRAWVEPTVRPWWLMAIAVLLAVGGYSVAQLVERSALNRLMTAGVPVAAKVVSTDNRSIVGQAATTEEQANLTFDWHGQPSTARGFLSRNSTIGATIPIRVDPADPTVWTDQTEPAPLVRSLFVGLAVLPLAPALLAVAVVRRRAVARTVRLGRAAVAVVADRRQTPIAPFSYAVRCALRDGADRRLRTVYVPHVGRSLAKGDEVWLILPLARGGRPVAAAWFGLGSAECGVRSAE